MTLVSEFRVEARGDGWVVTSPSAVGLQLGNDYLGYLGDRHYAPGTRRSYAFDLLALCRWLEEQHLRLTRWTPRWCCGSSAAAVGWRRRR
jgi:hypothetical protein